jgi:hypothetical protein
MKWSIEGLVLGLYGYDLAAVRWGPIQRAGYAMLG